MPGLINGGLISGNWLMACLLLISIQISLMNSEFHCRYEIRMNLAEFAASTATDVNQTELEIYYHPIPVSVFFSFLGDLV